MIIIQNYINGKFQSTDKNIEDINPATGEIIASIPKSNSSEVQMAVDAADKARNNWSD